MGSAESIAALLISERVLRENFQMKKKSKAFEFDFEHF
jgi:hypothetical protein